VSKRKSLRISDHNYSDPKRYYVTINVISRELTVGEIINGKVNLNEIGEIVEKCWKKIPIHFEECELDEFIIMPDHIHGIIRINVARGVGNRHVCSLHLAMISID
jgi:REP-associated tyrosine transposase